MNKIENKKHIYYLFNIFALPKTPSVTTHFELDVQYQGDRSPVSKSPFFTIFSTGAGSLVVDEVVVTKNYELEKNVQNIW